MLTILSICFVFFLIINTVLEFSYTTEFYKQTLKNIRNLEILEKEIPDLKDNTILYIGNGIANYYLKTSSYTSYTTTIFLANYNTVYLNNAFVKKLKEDIKNYDGKYIIIDEIEFLNKFRVSDDIIDFINQTYHYQQSTGISLYEMKCDEYSIIYERNT